MDQAGIKEVCDAIITRPGFKQFMSGEIARQLKETKPKKETATLKPAMKREKAVKK